MTKHLMPATLVLLAAGALTACAGGYAGAYYAVPSAPPPAGRTCTWGPGAFASWCHPATESENSRARNSNCPRGNRSGQVT